MARKCPPVDCMQKARNRYVTHCIMEVSFLFGVYLFGRVSSPVPTFLTVCLSVCLPTASCLTVFT